MKSIRLLALIGLTAFVSVQAHASRPYGNGGCGLGSVLMGKEGSQVLAATTNGSSGTQTFGITSGTSNCKPSGDTASNLKIYVEANKVALANDIARGSGDTVMNLAALARCSDVGAFAATMQKNYSRIYPTQAVEAGAVSQQIISTIKADSALSASCNLTI
jgi:hypothetical protein